MKEIIAGPLPVHIDKLVGIGIHPLKGGVVDCVDIGEVVNLFFMNGTLETFGLAIMAYVEAGKAGKEAAEKLTDAEARDYIDKHTHTQDAEDWNAEKADAEAL